MKNRISFSHKLVALTVMSGLSVALSPISAALAAPPPSTVRVSVSSSGEEGNNGSINSSQGGLSANGRFVLFVSGASNWVAGDNNNDTDLFVRDLKTGTTRLVSINSAGTASANGGSGGAVVSANGRFVAFGSSSSDLVANDTNGLYDLFVRDLKTGTTTLVSINNAGTGTGNAGVGGGGGWVLSADGRFVAFGSSSSDLVANDTNGLYDLFVRDLKTGTTTLASINSAGTASGNGSSNQYNQPSLSANGRYVAFISDASDLVANDTNGLTDVFVRDLKTGTTTLVSINSAGTASGNSISNSFVLSADGRYVVFSSFASDLVAGDNNGNGDVFVRDLKTGTTRLVSINSAGTASANGGSGGAVVSANGRFVAFSSFSTDLVAGIDIISRDNIYVRDLKTGKTTLVSINSAGTASGNGGGSSLSHSGINPSVLSADGRFIVFSSDANDLVSYEIDGTANIYVRDLKTGVTTLANFNSAGTVIDNNTLGNFSLSANGRFVVFESDASGLAANDTNGLTDAFVRDLKTGTTKLVSINRAGTASGIIIGTALLSANGRFVAFTSDASDLVLNDNNGFADVFIRPNR